MDPTCCWPRKLLGGEEIVRRDKIKCWCLAFSDACVSRATVERECLLVMIWWFFMYYQTRAVCYYIRLCFRGIRRFCGEDGGDDHVDVVLVAFGGAK